MAELALTAERRSELIDLLGDDDRPRAEYPKVSEHLEMSPQLAGTGDVQVDAAFELRIVHYMTCDRSKSPNPYWDIVSPFVSERDGRRAIDGGKEDGSPRLAFRADALAGRLRVRAPLAGDPPDKAENISFPRSAGQADTWHPVGGLSEFDMSAADRTDQVLFLCWPPGWGDTMASEALTGFEQAGGTRLIFIGQPRGGMTGDDAFFDALAADWEPASEDSKYSTWWNLVEVAQGWVRR